MRSLVGLEFDVWLWLRMAREKKREPVEIGVVDGAGFFFLDTMRPAQSAPRLSDDYKICVSTVRRTIDTETMFSTLSNAEIETASEAAS